MRFLPGTYIVVTDDKVPHIFAALTAAVAKQYRDALAKRDGPTRLKTLLTLTATPTALKVVFP